MLSNTRPEEDDLPDLPPLDGDVDDRETDPDRLDDDEMPPDDADPFDDATGEGDALTDLDALSDTDEQASLLDAVESEGLDVGAADDIGAEGDRLTDDGREPRDDDASREDYGLGDEGSVSALDGGEEGPSTDDDSLSDDGLPALDADDDGPLDDAGAFFDGVLGRPRADVWGGRWERFGAPLSLPPTRALAVASDGVLLAGRGLLRASLEGGVETLEARGLRGGELTHVLPSAAALYVTTETGGLFVSYDRGATFRELSGWREHVRPEEAAAGLDVVVTASGALWARTAQGSLLSSEPTSSKEGASRWEKADVDGFVHALAVDHGGDVVALVRTPGDGELLRRRGAGWAHTPLPAELTTPGLSQPSAVVAWGESAAVAVEGLGVFRAASGGPWARVRTQGRVGAMAMLDPAGALVVAHASGDAAVTLLYAGASGEPLTVAHLGLDPARTEPSDGDAAAAALAVDEAHQVVWVGGAFGVAAFQPTMRG